MFTLVRSSLLIFTSLIFLTLSLFGCVSTVPVEPVEPGMVDRDNLPPEPATETLPSNRVSRAVADLMQGSQREYDRGDWDSAIATAERALRIDRRQPGIYLIIAKSYRAMGDTQQARQFVEQGLRYISDKDTAVARELNWLADALP